MPFISNRSENGISVNPESIEAVKNWPIRKNKKNVESFLGFTNYHRKHIKNFSKIAIPLQDLTGQKIYFHWNNEHQESCESLILVIYASDKYRSWIEPDSRRQRKDNKLWGEKLATTQKKYCTTRKELLAIVAFTWQYIHYLLGKLFVTRTAHNSLTWLLSFKNIEGQLARWIKDLAQYHMVIQHRAAKKTLKCLCAVKNTWWIPTMWRVRSRGTSE